MRILGRLTVALLLQGVAGTVGAQTVYTYIGEIESRSVLLAWGNTKGPNTIGRSSASLGHAIVTIAGRKWEADRNWIVASGLEPDRDYAYEVAVAGRKVGAGTVRTYPETANRVCFFVMGDWGTGTPTQNKVAEVMWKQFEAQQRAGCPARFVLSTGDNIYADINFGFRALHSGDDDADWAAKFFKPYEQLLKQIPFYPTLGNHDGNSTESRGDLAAYLDNFFFPRNEPARWYSFSFGGLVDFFALDSTNNTESGPPRPAYADGGEQFRWFRQGIAGSRAVWKIPYFHHPVFNAGPYHGASYNDLKHFVTVFEKSGVKVVFTGHEHNFQVSEDGPETGGIRYVVSGAGGELRHGSVLKRMKQAHIAAWAPQNHFLSVEIDGKTMRITPVSFEKLEARDPGGKLFPLPLTVKTP